MRRLVCAPAGVWPADGEVPDAGVLLHCFAGDSKEQKWAELRGGADLAATLVFGAQRATGASELPLSGGCAAGGVVVRPGGAGGHARGNRINCGAGAPHGGVCKRLCAPPLEGVGNFTLLDAPGDGCSGGSWAPADVGRFLERVTAWQAARRQPGCNELVVDGVVFAAALPFAAEAIFDAPGVHRQFLAAHGLRAEDQPLLRLRLDDWEAPFAAASEGGE